MSSRSTSSSITTALSLFVAFSLFACDDGAGGGGGDAGMDLDADTDTDSDTDGDADFQIDRQRIHDDVAYLADDAREGREPGTAGNQAALDYVAAAFEDMGLEPAGDEGTYFDAFSYPQWRETVAPSLVVDGTPAVAGTDFDVLRYSPSGVADGVVVFAGYGLIILPYDPQEYPDCPYPPEGLNEYEGLELAGNVVLKFSGAPNQDLSVLTDCPVESARTYVQDAGGTTVINVKDYQSWPHDGLVAGATLAWNDDYPFVAIYVSRTFAQSLVPDLEARYGVLSAYGGASYATEHTVSVSVETEVTTDEIHNVLGVVPGTDPALREEVVLVGGHIDHVGRELGTDAIYNGADDNASGTAVTMELARAVAAMPGGPARTVVFAAWNAEECGLLGSCAYVEDPHYPLDDMAAVLNLDAVGAGDGSGAWLISGADPQNEWLSDLMRASAEEEGIWFVMQTSAHFDSSDHSCFFQAGVPAVTMQTLGGHLATHTQDDDIDVINLDDLEIAARLSWAALRPLAEGTEARFE